MVSNTIELDMCIFPKVDLVKEKKTLPHLWTNKYKCIQFLGRSPVISPSYLC